MQERVARHLAMVAFLIDDDPELAHQHALSANRRAGRIPVARETLAITAYRTGDFALALRELRTHRRLSGLDGHVSLMVDCERGLGRPDKAIETGLEIDASRLDTEQRVHLAIAMSGARLDLGQTQQALFELEIPELNPSKAFSWSPGLFAAYSAVLEDLGRSAEATKWLGHAEHAARALQAHHGSLDELEVFEVYEDEVEDDRVAEIEDEAAAEAIGEFQSVDPTAVEIDPSEETEAAAAVERTEVESAFAPAEQPEPEADQAEEDQPVADQAEAEQPELAGDESHLYDEEMSIEDEVDELLAAAGIVDTSADNGEKPDAAAEERD
ncbi:hypothetical protein [Leucobacter sp. NPDC077196]|uniref:hypothetical protein n=1 Tax=Leucobacter sp. NPDC077196 TaxID=3154959 RepID=UPI003442D968